MGVGRDGGRKEEEERSREGGRQVKGGRQTGREEGSREGGRQVKGSSSKWTQSRNFGTGGTRH